MNQARVGQRVLCNGFIGAIRQVHEGQLKGMADVQLDRGQVCVSIQELESASRGSARRKWGESYGAWYWAKRQKQPQAEIVAHILEYRKWRAIWNAAPFDTNERGNTIYRDEDADHKLGIRRGGDRYYYDFKALTDWNQFDTKQDASYFGVWVNVEKLMTFTYAEGDRTLIVCPDKAHLKAELDDAVAFYGDPPPMAVGFDLENKTRTEFYDTRPTVELE